MTRSNSEWWKHTATAAVTACISMAGMWLGILPNYATKTEVRQMIITESPYMRDASLIKKTQENNQIALSQLTHDVRDLVKSSATLTAKIDLLISNPKDKYNE